MSASYSFEHDHGLIIYRFSGAQNTETVLEIIHAAITDPGWSSEYDMMCLFEHADLSAFTVDEAKRLSRAIKALNPPAPDEAPIRAALVSTDELAEGLLAFWERLGIEGRTATDRVFTDEADARAWLTER